MWVSMPNLVALYQTVWACREIPPKFWATSPLGWERMRTVTHLGERCLKRSRPRPLTRVQCSGRSHKFWGNRLFTLTWYDIQSDQLLHGNCNGIGKSLWFTTPSPYRGDTAAGQRTQILWPLWRARPNRFGAWSIAETCPSSKCVYCAKFDPSCQFFLQR